MVSGCYNFVNKKMGTVFATYGLFVTRHPWKMIVICIITNCVLGLGLVRIEFESNTEFLYTPQNSRAFSDRDKVKQIFPDRSRDNFYFQNIIDFGNFGEIIIRPFSGNILESEIIDEIKSIHTYAKGIIAAYDGNEVTFNDVCGRRHSECVINGAEFLQPYITNELLLKNVSYPDYRGIRLSLHFGGVATENGFLVSAKTFKLRYNLRTDLKGPAEKWEEAFIDSMKALKTNRTEVAFAHSDSMNVELNANILSEIALFAITFVLMCVYACLATVKSDCLSDRSLLGIAGVVSTLLAIVGAFGLCSACGVTFVNIVGVAPFLIIGIGVDDMFILLSGMAETLQTHDSVEGRISMLMKTSALAITITSVTDLLAFSMGATSIFPAVQNFCIYTGISILFAYINYMTLFLGCIIIDQRRIALHLHSKTCIVIRTEEELQLEGKGQVEMFCCSGVNPKTRQDVDSPLERYPRNCITIFSLTDAVKPFVILLFTLYLAIAIWGCSCFKENLLLQQLVHDDSYYHKYCAWNVDYYDAEVVVMLVIDEKVDYVSPKIRQNIQDVLDMSKANVNADSQFYISWLRAYSMSAYFDSSTPETFVTNLKTFLDDDKYKIYENDVVFTSTNSDIRYSRFYVRSANFDDTDDQGDLLLDLRQICDDSPLPIFPHNTWFIYGEQYVNIMPQTIQTLGVATASIFFVVFVFMPHPFVIILVMFAMASIMTGLIGFMYFWDLTLSSITMIQIIMSVGFSVDYSAHICHAFVSSEGETRSERVAKAMREAGGPVFSGAFSSFLGIVVLAFSGSFIFRSFFKVMVLVIVIGVTHALIILPIIMSLIGPLNSNLSKKNEKLQSTSTILPGSEYRIPRPLFETINIIRLLERK